MISLVQYGHGICMHCTFILMNNYIRHLALPARVCGTLVATLAKTYSSLHVDCS